MNDEEREKKNRVLAMREAGVSHAEIARSVDIEIKTVYKWIEFHEMRALKIDALDSNANNLEALLHAPKNHLFEPDAEGSLRPQISIQSIARRWSIPEHSARTLVNVLKEKQIFEEENGALLLTEKGHRLLCECNDIARTLGLKMTSQIDRITRDIFKIDALKSWDALAEFINGKPSSKHIGIAIQLFCERAEIRQEFFNACHIGSVSNFVIQQLAQQYEYLLPTTKQLTRCFEIATKLRAQEAQRDVLARRSDAA